MYCRHMQLKFHAWVLLSYFLNFFLWGTKSCAFYSLSNGARVHQLQGAEAAGCKVNGKMLNNTFYMIR